MVAHCQPQWYYGRISAGDPGPERPAPEARPAQAVTGPSNLNGLQVRQAAPGHVTARAMQCPSNACAPRC